MTAADNEQDNDRSQQPPPEANRATPRRVRAVVFAAAGNDNNLEKSDQSKIFATPER